MSSTHAVDNGVDERTPVLVGVGQVSERLGTPGYESLSALDLSARAALAALVDTGVAVSELLGSIDAIAMVRQLEFTDPLGGPPLGQPTNPPRSLARRIGADPKLAVLASVGGQGPQSLVGEFAARIAAGECELVLLASGEAAETATHLLRSPQGPERPDWSEEVPGTLDARPFEGPVLLDDTQLAHGLWPPPAVYAVMENARRARLGLNRAEYARAMGELFVPFSRVAAANPHAARPFAATVAELVTPSPANRIIAEPYPRALVANDRVNQAAAVVMTTVANARRLGIAPERAVYLHGHAEVRERTLLRRPDLAGQAVTFAVQEALVNAGVGLPDVQLLDLYSCFPIAVFAACDSLGLSPQDERGLTLTGGLPFFGGPGNGYLMHALVHLVARLRSAPEAFGLVEGVGGFMNKSAAGVYSALPRDWKPARNAEAQARLDAVRPVPVRDQAAGPGVIESWTLRHDRDGVASGFVLGRLADGSRFLGHPDAQVLALLAELDQPVGTAVRVSVESTGNVVRPA